MDLSRPRWRRRRRLPRRAGRRTRRSARVRADVHAAVEAPQREHPLAEMTMARIAERSGVHLGTLYRRWGSVDAVLLDVVFERLSARSPVPDTGDVANNLREYARQAAEDLAAPEGSLLLRALVSVRLGGERPSSLPAVTRRFAELQYMLDRAASRARWCPQPRRSSTSSLPPCSQACSSAPTSLLSTDWPRGSIWSPRTPPSLDPSERGRLPRSGRPAVADPASGRGCATYADPVTSAGPGIVEHGSDRQLSGLGCPSR